MTFYCADGHADCGNRCQRMSEVLDFINVLNDENHMRIICVLSNTKNFRVGEITEGVKKSQNLVSHHLKALLKINLVDRTKVGLEVYYKLNQGKINDLYSALGGLLNQK